MTTSPWEGLTWAVLPGLALTPHDMAGVAKLLPGPSHTLDAWQVPVTAPAAELRSALGLDGAAAPRVGIVAHSIGALGALEWRQLYPEQVAVVVLLDPTSPWEPDIPWLHPGHTGHRLMYASAEGLLRAVPSAALRGRRVGFRYFGQPHSHHHPADVRARFEDRRGVLGIVDQLSQGYEQARRVRRLLTQAQTEKTPAPAHTVQLVGMGNHGRRNFLREQRELGVRLGASVLGLPGESHLFPISRPEVVAEVLQGVVPAGSRTPHSPTPVTW